MRLNRTRFVCVIDRSPRPDFQGIGIRGRQICRKLNWHPSRVRRQGPSTPQHSGRRWDIGDVGDIGRRLPPCFVTAGRCRVGLTFPNHRLPLRPGCSRGFSFQGNSSTTFLRWPATQLPPLAHLLSSVLFEGREPAPAGNFVNRQWFLVRHAHILQPTSRFVNKLCTQRAKPRKEFSGHVLISLDNRMLIGVSKQT